MKAFFGLSDSLAGVVENPVKCSDCEAATWLGAGLCVNCLLNTGLHHDQVDDGIESLDVLLDAVNVPDQTWRLGNYEILEEIGRGGMGVIYRARQRHSRRIVAVKRVLNYHADSHETLERFRREAEAVASLDHPNILPIHEVSQAEDGIPFFSMKYASGGSLREAATALRNNMRTCVALVAKVARAIQYAHRQGILHRDLKPGNILLDARGEPMVTDFGLAKWLDTNSDLTRTLTIFGTPGYIAPEQAQASAKQLTPAADVYSLGAILFDLLCGRPPFIGSHALSVIRQASETSAPKIRSLSKLADRDLETICAKCLEREPRARYHSAGDLAEDLERWLDGRPIIARPVSPPTRVWRWSKRNPKLAGSLVVVMILSATGVAALLTSSRLSSVIQNAELARHSIVVTPFENLDSPSTGVDPAQTVTSAFAAALTEIKGIRAVIGKTPDADPWSTEDWKKIGNVAGVRIILSGSVRQRQGKYRVAVHLIEAVSGSVITTWSQDVETPSDLAKASLPKLLAVLDITPRRSLNQQDLAMAEGDVNELGATRDLSARAYYERGRELFLRNNFPDLGRAIESLQRAIEIDPNYAQSHAMLATACGWFAAVEPGTDWLERADVATAIALRLAPMLPETRLAHAENLKSHGRPQTAIDEFLTAYELDSRSARICAKIATAYDAIGRPDLAIRWFEKATHREVRPIYADNLGDAWTDLGDYEKAEAAYRDAAVFRPDIPGAALGFARVALLRGDYTKAYNECAAARMMHKDNPQPLMMAALIEFFSRHFDSAEKLYVQACLLGRARGVDFPRPVRFISALGFIQQLSRTHAGEGRALLEESLAFDQAELSLTPENPKCLYSLAADEAALGNKEAAIAALEKALNAGWIDYHSMTLDPRFDAIRTMPGFQQAIANLQQAISRMVEKTNR